MTLRMGTITGRWVVTATVLGSGMAALDATVVAIALPTIGVEFHTELAALQWVVTAYTLTLSGLLLLGGSLGDRFGRRRVFRIGVVWFAVASLACALAPDAPALIAARGLQGVGGALLTPGSLAILQASFAPSHRAKAIGAWAGLGGVASAAGPFLGGWLIDSFSWRFIFLINLPVAAVVVAITTRHVPESASPAAGRTDLRGAALITGGLVGVVFGLIEGSNLGWGAPGILTAFVAGAILLVGFVVFEARSSHPMLPLAMFRSAAFSGTNAVTFLVYGAMGGTMFLVPIALQQVAGYSALAAGVAVLPATALLLVGSTSSGALAGRIGPRLQMTAGPLVVAAGLALFSRITLSGDYLTEVLPAVIVFGLGLVIIVAPLTATVLAAAPTERAGIASAVNNDVARAAALIAVAVLPVAGGITGATYLHPAAFASGFHTAVLVAAVLCALGGPIAFWSVRNPQRQTRP